MTTTLKLTYEHKDHPKGELTITGEKEYVARVLRVPMRDMLWAMGVREAGGKFKFHLENDEFILSARLTIRSSIFPLWLGDVIMEACKTAEVKKPEHQPAVN